MRFLYQLGIKIYVALIHIAAWWNPKAKSWVSGRKSWQFNLDHLLREHRATSQRIWFHCASLGEYEQAIPVISTIRTNYPNALIVVSFFSPSGYESFKKNDLVDFVTYLPADTQKNAQAFIETLKPTVAYFVKYEIWHMFIHELYQKKIPTYLIAAIFRTNHIYFKFYGAWFRHTLTKFQFIFVQDQPSLDLLQKFNLLNSSVSGDTRIDRVIQNLSESKTVPQVVDFLAGKPCLILGSAWLPELQILKIYLENTKSTEKVIIAPHEVNNSFVDEIISLFPNHSVQRLSKYNPEINSQILIIDSIGQLKYLYQYANMAFIGGGFGSGLHNILEAVTFGIPVIFGPQISNHPEAKELIERKSAFMVSNATDFITLIERFQKQPMLFQIVADMSKKYIQDHSGATNHILHTINSLK